MNEKLLPMNTEAKNLIEFKINKIGNFLLFVRFSSIQIFILIE